MERNVTDDIPETRLYETLQQTSKGELLHTGVYYGTWLNCLNLNQNSASPFSSSIHWWIYLREDYKKPRFQTELCCKGMIHLNTTFELFEDRGHDIEALKLALILNKALCTRCIGL